MVLSANVDHAGGCLPEKAVLGIGLAGDLAGVVDGGGEGLGIAGERGEEGYASVLLPDEGDAVVGW